MDINTTNLEITKLTFQKNFVIDVLRLDKIHPMVSGNKWYKLKYNLQAAIDAKATCIITHGGPFSNHLHATAFACKALSIDCIGLVNGKETTNQTLQDCEAWGMEIQFIGYANKEQTIEKIVTQIDGAYFIAMGGDNDLGVQGATEILNFDLQNYSHILCSVGTGTTFAGIVKSAKSYQKMLGFSAIVDDKVANKLKHLLPENTNWELINEYSFGGFAKINDALEDYIYNFFDTHQIVLDVVYTAKMFFGLEDLISKNYFLETDKILCIHTGGVQGNSGFGIELNS